MNKLYTTILAGLALCLGSCSMELTPHGEILDTQALQSVKDFESFSNGLYSQMRSITSGDFVVLSDIQLDDFHAVIGNGNRRMEFYNGAIKPSTGEIASIYAGYYSVIAQANFFLDKAMSKSTEGMSTIDQAKLNNTLAVAHFVRAYCYNSLADKFCGSYKHTADLDKPGLGLSLQLTYSPTADNTTYPARTSMRETYKQILADLDLALAEATKLTESDSLVQTVNANMNYITADVIKAMQARVNLNMGIDSTAYKLANGLIAKYQLTPRTDFKTLWTNDMGTEVIWQVAADYTYHGSASGTAFASNINNSDYVPTADCINLFDENDVRWSVWFEDTKVSNSGGNASMFRFMKYPGNPELYNVSAGSNFVNKAKPFRVAEMYLIAAEAAFNSNNELEANRLINLLKYSRINRFRGVSLVGTDLLEEIMNERHRELIGEGFRLADLKRWQVGFTRGEVWEGNDQVIVSNYKDLHYEADDYRYVWPIPQHEMDANPQLRGQQNPGY